MGTGTDAAIEAADLTLVRGELLAVPTCSRYPTRSAVIALPDQCGVRRPIHSADFARHRSGRHHMPCATVADEPAAALT